MMTRALLWFGLVSSLAFWAVCAYFSLVDWQLLRRSYAALNAAQHGDLKTIVWAEAQQNSHRINVFADVVWALLCAILAVVSATGLAILRRPEGKQ